jgi:hypothetical protein
VCSPKKTTSLLRNGTIESSHFLLPFSTKEALSVVSDGSISDEYNIQGSLVYGEEIAEKNIEYTDLAYTDEIVE